MVEIAQHPWLWRIIELMAAVFILMVGLAILATIVIYFIDRFQTKHAIRHNYPVIGRFRYLFEELGEYFRQYFFAMDREEMPFNRAQRAWVYRAAKGEDTTVAFGSTRDLRPAGTIMFVNSAFPPLDSQFLQPAMVEVGPYCDRPFRTASFFNISAMSFGALSEPAVRALSHGAARAGCWMNTGEGGLAPYHLEGGCDVIFQIGTAKYGVRTHDGALDKDKLRKIAAHDQVKMFEVKLSQGAKPGKGGILPGQKVTKQIAEIRGIPVGHDSISPNRHPEIDSFEDLLDFLEEIRAVTGKPVGFKMVIGAYDFLDDFFDEINRRGIERAPDFITIDSADGGTGAAPMPLIDYMGLPIWESLPMVVDALERHRLKSRIRVIASGKLINPAEVAWALAVGADFVNSARGFMLSIGCIQALQCHKNTCPTGVTTHDKRLQAGLDITDKSERAARYAKRITYEVCMIAHSCGVDEPRKLRRSHARIMSPDGISVSLEEYYRAWMSPEALPSAEGLSRPRFAPTGSIGGHISERRAG